MNSAVCSLYRAALGALIILTLYSSCTKEEKPIQPETGKPTGEITTREKILYVDSYSLDYQWIQGITRGILETLNISMNPDGTLDNSRSGYDLQIFHMNSKRNPSEKSIKEAAEEAHTLIETWNPDLIITSDDNAAKYLIVPYLMDSGIPVVFCGINWDASVYGLPTSSITGMVEINLIDSMVKELLHYSKGGRIAYIRDNTTTSRKESENYEKLLGTEIIKRFPTTFSSWKEDFLSLQKEADIILVGYPSALEDWDGNTEPYQAFLRENTEVPTGSWDEWNAGWVLLSYTLSAEEQGEYAASTAIRILEGESPGTIPVVQNKKASVYLNMGMAKKLGIIFPMDLIERSHMLENWFDESAD